MRGFPILIGLVLLVVLAGLGQSVSTMLPNDHAHMRPGTTYIANFTHEERRNTCLKLSYAEHTAAFEDCVQGDFPENPWFTGYPPLRLALARGH